MKTAMEYFLSQTGIMQVRWDKPNILLDNSVPEFLAERKINICKKCEAKTTLTKIISDNIQDYPWKKFGTHEEVHRILLGVLREICLEEMEVAIELFKKRGILKTVNYLLSCVE